MSGGGLTPNSNIDAIVALANSILSDSSEAESLLRRELGKRGIKWASIKSLGEYGDVDDLQFKLNVVLNPSSALIGQPNALIEKLGEILADFFRGPKKKKKKP